VLGVVDVGGVDQRAEVSAGAGRDARLGSAMDQRVVRAAIADQIGDRRDLEVVGRG
jgi:hypothetical protein